MNLSHLLKRVRTERGLTNCARGKHGKLEWHRVSKQKPILINNQPMEMLHACGFLGHFVRWTGWCPRCKQPIEWADHKPRDINPKTGSIRR